MSGKFAADTSVSSDKSISEIQGLLRRYGADSFAQGWDRTTAVVMFQAEGRHVKFVLPMPDRQSSEFTLTPTKRARSKAQADAAYEQAIRQRWRALKLVIQAKLEAVETGITTFDSEFLAHLVLPNGETVGEWAIPQVAQAYESAEMPALLPGGRP